MEVRPPAAAGVLYPSDRGVLRATLRTLLDDALPEGPAPKALIVPHAAYQDVGPLAAVAYARLAQDRDVIRRIILLGPAHFVRLAGIALCSAGGFATPLGILEVDRRTVGRLSTLPSVSVEDLAHAFEHSLEVQLPFLQETLEEIVIVPLAVGQLPPEVIGLVLNVLWGGPETRLIISSDLSHYLDSATASTLDEATAQAIESLQRQGVVQGMACGRAAINGLLWIARARQMRVERIGLSYSHQPPDAESRVVGHGVFAFYE
jgi:AmmeMemoRadiSam system protein B